MGTAKASTKRGPAISIYLTPETHMEFKMAATRTHRPMADIGQELVENWLKEYENSGKTSTAVSLNAAHPQKETAKLQHSRDLINEYLGENQ